MKDKISLLVAMVLLLGTLLACHDYGSMHRRPDPYWHERGYYHHRGHWH